VLENVKLILDDQGLTFAQVVKSTVFLTDLAEFAGMNEVYARYFPGDFPARSTIQVAALPRGASVEIEVVAGYGAFGAPNLSHVTGLVALSSAALLPRRQTTPPQRAAGRRRRRSSP
jgi:hypothetical protein